MLRGCGRCGGDETRMGFGEVPVEGIKPKWWRRTPMNRCPVCNGSGFEEPPREEGVSYLSKSNVIRRGDMYASIGTEWKEVPDSWIGLAPIQLDLPILVKHHMEGMLDWGIDLVFASPL